MLAPLLPRFPEEKTKLHRSEFVEFNLGYLEAICEYIGLEIRRPLNIRNIDKLVIYEAREHCAIYFNKYYDLLKYWPTSWNQKGSDFWYLRNKIKDSFTIPQIEKGKKHLINTYGLQLAEETLNFGFHELRPITKNDEIWIVHSIKKSFASVL